jgi:hypothetical protein
VVEVVVVVAAAVVVVLVVAAVVVVVCKCISSARWYTRGMKSHEAQFKKLWRSKLCGALQVRVSCMMHNCGCK